MAQENRPLVIQDGVQKRIPDSQALEVGSVGIVASNDGVVQKLQIGHADNVDAKPIELLGSAHFQKNVKIEGELQVVGNASIVDTLVAQTIFEESVKFGDGANAKTGDKALFDSSIRMDTEQESWLKTAEAGNNLTFEAADAAVTISAKENSKFEVTGGLKILSLLANADAGNLIEIRSSSSLVGQGQSSVQLHVDTTGNVGAAAELKLDQAAASSLKSQNNQNLEIRARGTGAAFIDAGATSHFKTTAGDLDLQSFVGVLDMDGNSVELDSETTLSIDSKDDSNLTMTADSADDKELTIVAQNAGAGAASLLLTAKSLASVQAPVITEFAQSGPFNMFSGPSLLAVGATNPGEMFQGADSKMSFESLGDIDATAAAQVDINSTSSYVEMYARATPYANAAWDAERAAGHLLLDADEDIRSHADVNISMQAGSPSAPMPVIATGTASIVLWSSGDLRAAVDNTIDLKSVDASAWEVSNGDLDLKATAKKLRLSTGAHAPVQTEADLDIVLAADNNVIADADNMFFLRSGSEFRAESSALMEVKAAGLMTLDADASMSMDIEGGLTITVDSDASGNAGDVTLDANYDVAKTQGGNVSIHAGNDDKGYFRVAAGERVAGTWAAPNDGEIELRAQMDLRLRAAGDLRMEVGSSKDVILDDSSAGLFDEENELGHARIRNVKDPTHAQDVVTKKYMEENGGGTVKLIAFEVLAKGDLVALEGTTGKVQKADAASNDYLFGIATDAAVQDGEILVRMLGKFDLGAPHGQTPGTPFYMDANGAASATAPSAEGSSVQRAGLYLAGSEVLMLIGEPVIL